VGAPTGLGFGAMSSSLRQSENILFIFSAIISSILSLFSTAALSISFYFSMLSIKALKDASHATCDMPNYSKNFN
jgi:hypothetical protein